MKKPLTSFVIALCLHTAAHAQALDIKPVTVTAEVLNTCRFNVAASVDLMLGPLNPVSAVNTRSSRAVSLQCTNGFPIQIGIAGQAVNLTPGTGLTRQLVHKVQAAHTLAYTLSASLPDGTVGKGFGPGNQLTLNLDATVLGGVLPDALGGSYEDTLIVELRP